MVKLHAAYGLKVPGPQEYSSESFHASAEIELADSLANKPDALKAALNLLWSDLKSAVAEQVRTKNSAPAGTSGRNGHNGNHNGNGHTGNNGNGQRPEPVNRISGNGNPMPASKKQVGFLMSLARRKRNLGAEQLRKWLQAERGLNLNELSKQQAGTLIDEFNTSPA